MQAAMAEAGVVIPPMMAMTTAPTPVPTRREDTADTGADAEPAA